MDYKQLRKRMATAMNREPKDIDALTEGLGIIIREAAANMDSVAIPTFGTFVPVKHPEEVVNDLSTGRKLLCPPEMVLTFTPGGVLRKNIEKK